MPPTLLVVTALALAHQYTPGVAPDTSVSIAKADRLHALAVHGNTSRPRYAPETPGAATTLATDPIVAQHQNVDFNVMQANRASPPAVDPSIADGFDAGQSMSAGSEIFAHACHHVLAAPLFTYNPGDPIRGITNGYVADVEVAATAVPSIVAFAPHALARAAPTHDVAASARCGEDLRRGQRHCRHRSLA